jgi:uncharacterized membrane protein
MRDWGWLLVSIVGWGVWPVTQAMAARSMSPMSVMLANACICTAIAPIIYVWMRASGQAPSFNVPGALWTLGSVVLAGAAGIGFLFATKFRPANEVLSYTQVYPALSFVMCWLALGESFTVTKVVGAAMLITGGIVMNR